MKTIFLTLAIALSFSQAHAGCGEQLRAKIAKRVGLAVKYLEHQVKPYEFVRYEKIKSSQKAKVTEIMAKHGVSGFKGERFVDAVNSMIMHVAKKHGQSLKAGEALAQFGKDLRKVYEKNGAETTVALDSFIGIGISRLEAYKPSEYQQRHVDVLHNTEGGKLIRPGEYKEWVSSYVNKEGKYEQMKESELGVIDEADYRNITAHNLWPLFMKDHDMRHVHYSVSHPKVMAAILQAARGKNHKRYFLLTSLFEGVDTIQYTHETQLARYFSNKGYTLEQAMMFLSRASSKELDKVARDAGVKETMREHMEEYRDFRPAESGEFRLVDKGRRLLYEIDKMLEDFHRYTKEDRDVNMDGVLEYHPNPHGQSNIPRSESERIRY